MWSAGHRVGVPLWLSLHLPIPALVVPGSQLSRLATPLLLTALGVNTSDHSPHGPGWSCPAPACPNLSPCALSPHTASCLQIWSLTHTLSDGLWSLPLGFPRDLVPIFYAKLTPTPLSDLALKNLLFKLWEKIRPSPSIYKWPLHPPPTHKLLEHPICVLGL